MKEPNDDSLVRCWWCGSDQEYVRYHDHEWGIAVTDDRLLFEKLSLEGFQSGLSWITILRKRPAFREVFFDFDPTRVSTFTAVDVRRLLRDARIVRHRGKIEAVVNNARAYAELVAREGSLARFAWGFAPARAPVRRTRAEIPSTTAESVAFSKELRRRGWRFVGPTTAYAFFQAMGLVNDHVRDCFRFAAASERRKQTLQTLGR